MDKTKYLNLKVVTEEPKENIKLGFSGLVKSDSVEMLSEEDSEECD